MLRQIAVAFLAISFVGCGSEQPVQPRATPQDQTDMAREKGKPPPDDGPREIVFQESVKTKGSPSGNRQWCVRAITVDGGNLVTVQCPDSGIAESLRLWSPTWAPTGTAVAYQAAGGTTSTGFVRDIYRVDIASDGTGTNVQRLLAQTECGGGCESPSWSPVGDEVAVIASDGNLLLVPATGCPSPSGDPCPRVLYSEPGTSFESCAWSPDATQLALKVIRDGVKSVVLIDHATGTPVGEFVVPGSGIDWGRGTRATTLAMHVFREGTNWADIFLFDMNTPEVPPQMVVEGGRFPSFSPDGNFIVYQALGERTAGGITKLELDTGVTTLLHRGNNPNQPDWRKPGPS